GRKSIVLALSGLDGKGFVSGLVRMLFVFYAKLYFAVSSAVCRQQELAADAAAARVAGTEAAASALREVETLAVSWKFFMNTYAGIGWNAGYLPSRFAQGFRSLLADDTRAKEIDEVRRNLPEEKTSRYDSHPATHERIAALHALPELPMRPGDDVPASEILRDAAGLLDQALLTNLSDEAKRKKRTDWETLVDVGIRHDIAETASKILGARTLGDLLDLLDAGRAVELADPDEKPPATAGPRAQREFFATSIRERLSIVASLALADAGAARWALSWSGPAEFVVAEPHRDALTPALDAATAVEADTAPLRALLAAAGVPAGYRPAVPARS
ncbi:MAG TPA: M48 family metalloprotease, partial [Amycolatopsis sp.]|nr:M48 family metalloprotease [Amycolatopsis sp.]